MGRYKDFEVCQACLICVGPECVYEKVLHRVGRYKLCGSCLQRMNEKGYIDLDSFRRLGEFTRLYPDGAAQRMKGVLNIRELEVIEKEVPSGNTRRGTGS